MEITLIETFTRKPETDLAANLKLAVELLRAMCDTVITPAHEEVMMAVPVFSGRYQEGVQVTDQVTGKVRQKRLAVSEESLRAYGPNAKARVNKQWTEISADEYIHGQAKPKKGKVFDIVAGGRYVERIEAIGSPLNDLGQGTWAKADEIARAEYMAFVEALEALAG